MYEIKERVRYSEVREDGKMDLLGVVNLLQDCSTFHSHDVGMSIERVLELKRAWLLSAWNIELYALPELYEELTVGTSPHLFRGIFAYRNFWIKNQSGDYLVKADSEWFCIDTEKGRPQKITDELVAPFGEPKDELHLPPLQRKISFPEEWIEGEDFLLPREYLDTNHHMNNARYIALSEEILYQISGEPAFSFTDSGCEKENGKNLEQGNEKEEKKLSIGIRAEYLKAYTYGDRIFPRIAMESERKCVAFYNQNKELCCHVEIRKNPEL